MYEKKVALVDVDNSEKIKFPNLLLMKASTYYKDRGFEVKLIHGKLLDRYNREYEKGKYGNAHKEFLPDIVIKSKVFTWTDDKNLFNSSNNIENYYFGGTGSDDISRKIEIVDPEIEWQTPDYDLYRGLYHYRSMKFEDAGIGFVTRGCPRKCSFCFVPDKEGMIKPYMTIDQFVNSNSKKLVLLDNNILAHKHGREQIVRMRDEEYIVDFNQGLDPRIIAENERMAKLLSELKWIYQIRLACDEQKDKPYLERAVELLRKHKCKGRMFAYTIITPDVEDAYDRIKFVDSLGVMPYAQSLRDSKNTEPTPYMKVLQKWVGSQTGFYAFSFEDYLNNILVWDSDKKKFKEVKDRHKVTKEWSRKNKGKPMSERNMDLPKTIKEIVDERIN